MSGWQLVRARARVADTVVATAAVLLAAACLLPLFVDMAWVPMAVVVILVIAVLGVVSRGLGMPVPFVPVVEALGLVLTLTALFASEQAWARVVPTSAAWDALGALMRAGLLDAEAYTAPVPTDPGLVLLAVGGVGVVALSTDTLFVSARSPVLAGLPLAALYLAPALILVGGAPWWSFPAAATGWLLILAADQRDQMRRWGRLPDTTRVRGLAVAGRRIGALAVLAATATAIVLPVRADVPWRTGEGSGAGTSADGGPVILDPLVAMRRNLVQANDTTVLTYRTQAQSPSYLRVSVLEDFDGNTWRPRPGLDSGRDGGIPLPGNVLSALVAASDSNRVTGGASYSYAIEIASLQNDYLPMPYPVSEVNDVAGLGSDWRMDPATGIAFSDDVPATGLSYQVAALDPEIQADQLSRSGAASGDLWPQLNLPGGLSPRIGGLAAEVTAGADTPYEKAVALQNWFTRDGDFSYSTNVRSGADADYLVEFLDQRIGYCEQFAGAMAVMARTIGIPSRVAVGFTQGARADDGLWRVSVRDAHAWPELWFDGVGWVRFEPTPRSGGTVLSPDYAGPTVEAADLERNLDRGLLDTEGFEPVDIEGPRGSVASWIVSAVVVVGLLILALPMIRRIVRRRRRLHAAEYGQVVVGAWAEVGDTAVDLGQPWSPFSTPRQAGDRLGRGMSEPAQQALRRLRQEVEQVRYAPPRPTTSRERSEAVRVDVRTVTRELRGRVRWQTRLAAYSWPSSDRRRHRSSMRSMNPEDFSRRGAAGAGAPAASSAVGAAPKAE